MKTGWIVVTESSNNAFSETEVMVGDEVYTNKDEAIAMFEETVANAKNETDDDNYNWLAAMLAENPEDVIEKQVATHYVSFEEKYGSNYMNIYLHEVNIK